MNLNILLDMDTPTLSYCKEQLLEHLSLLARKNRDIFKEHFPSPDASDYSVRLGVEPALSDAPDGTDCYRYGFSSDCGFITGSNARSVLLGVYGYLSDIGFVFCHPGEGGTYVPKLSSYKEVLRPATQRTAAFAHRGVCIEGANSLSHVLDFIEWLPKNGYNSFFVQFKSPDVFLERWYSHKFNPLLPEEPLSKESLSHMEHTIMEALSLRGLICHRVGHGWTAEALGYANTGWRVETKPLPPEVLPMVALVGGKRQLWGGISANTNLCYSNPAAKQKLVSQVVRYAKEHPETDYLHFWLADEYNNLCECEECAKTTLSDQYVELLNLLDKELTAAGLSTKIVFLLYQELLYAPLQEKITHPERFLLMFAPITRSFETPYPAKRCEEEVRPFVRNHVVLPQTPEENLTHYFHWKEHYPGDSFFYDYPLGRAHYGDFGYMKIAETIYRDIHALKSLESSGYMSCQELRAMLPTGFPNYVMGQALFDDALSLEELTDTYFHGLLGPEYKKALDWLTRLSKLSNTDYFNGKGPRLRPDLAENYRQIERISREFLPVPDETVLPDSQFFKHWQVLKYHATYCILLSAALEKLCDGKAGEANRAFGSFCRFIQEHEIQYQTFLDVYRVIEVATKYTGFSLEPESETT